MKARIGLDPWIGCGNIYRLPDDLRSFLRDNNITHIGHIADLERSTPFQQAWKTAPRLNIPHQWTQHCNTFIRALTEAHVWIKEEEDEVIWALSKSGKYTPKEGYLVLAEDRRSQALESQWNHIWKLKSPPRSKLLMWIILKKKIPTGDNLIK